MNFSPVVDGNFNVLKILLHLLWIAADKADWVSGKVNSYRLIQLVDRENKIMIKQEKGWRKRVQAELQALKRDDMLMCRNLACKQERWVNNTYTRK